MLNDDWKIIKMTDLDVKSQNIQQVIFLPKLLIKLIDQFMITLSLIYLAAAVMIIPINRPSSYGRLKTGGDDTGV